MLRRLLLSILVACLAAPAIAAPLCHAEKPVVSTHHGDHGAPAKQAPARDHQCIGCIAPFSMIAPIEEQPLPPSLTPEPLRTAQVAHAPGGPEPPPPRA